MKFMQTLSSLSSHVDAAKVVDSATANPIKVLMLGPSLNQQGGMASVEKLLVHRVTDGLKVHHISTHEEVSALQRLWIFQLALVQFLIRLLKNQVDLVHIHVSERASVFRAVVWVLLARLFRKPAVMHAHGCEFHTFYETLPRFAKHLVNRTFRQCFCFIALSQSWRDYYISHCRLSPERVLVLINPVALPEQVPNRQETEIVKFACLGRIGQRKGSFDLLRAFSQLSLEQKQRAKLILAGDGEVEEARRLASRLGIANRVECPGWLSSNECKKLLAKSDVFVLPSYTEGLPMAILEAMGWGLPVISTPVGGIPEVIMPNRNGLLVNPGNTHELASAMQLLLEDKEFRLALGNSARVDVEPFDVEVYCSQLVSIYQEAQLFTS